MRLFDTHCHIHEAAFKLKSDDATRALWLKAGSPDPKILVQQAQSAGLVGMICVGTTVTDSALAVELAQECDGVWASIGVHPHEAKIERFQELEEILSKVMHLEHSSVSHVSISDKRSDIDAGKANIRHRRMTLGATMSEVIEPKKGAGGTLRRGLASSVEPHRSLVMGGREEGTPFAAADLSARINGRSLGDRTHDVLQLSKLVAIGECGLDYFYNHSPKKTQIKALRFQIELALKYNLPLIFHVREAFDDFWPIFDEYKGIRGVIHSFTDTPANLDKILKRGLSVGVNGIATFTKNEHQLQAYKSIPLANLMLETDSPFLTPIPLRGRVNVPANTSLVAEFLAELRSESLSELAEVTTQNALKLFSIN